MQTSSVGSDMVANQSNLMKPKEFLKKLKKSSNGQYFVNTKEWKRGIEVCFNTFGLYKFLSEDYSIKVPDDQQWVCVFNQDMRATVRHSKKSVLLEKSQIKKEAIEERKALEEEALRRALDLESVTPGTPKKQSGDSARVLSSLDEKQAQYEAIVN